MCGGGEGGRDADVIVLDGDRESARARVSLSLTGERERNSVRECAEKIQNEMLCSYDHIYFG